MLTSRRCSRMPSGGRCCVRCRPKKTPVVRGSSLGRLSTTTNPQGKYSAAMDKCSASTSAVKVPRALAGHLPGVLRRCLHRGRRAPAPLRCRCSGRAEAQLLGYGGAAVAYAAPAAGAPATSFPGGQSAPQSADRSAQGRAVRRRGAAPASREAACPLVDGRGSSRTSCRQGTPVCAACSGLVSVAAGEASPPDCPRCWLGCQASIDHGGSAPPNPCLVAPLPRSA